MNLEALGFDAWFRDRLDPDAPEDRRIARVLAVHKNSYIVSDGGSETFAEASGKLLFRAESPVDFPLVGDWTRVQFFDGDTAAVIHDVLPRKTLLRRKTAGREIEIQPIAANIDTAVIVQSLDANFNLRRLERTMVMVLDAGIRPAVLLTKSDLADSETIERCTAEVHAVAPGAVVAAVSIRKQDDLAVLQGFFLAGKTHCLIGSSGVGKTTLLNALAGRELFKTLEVQEWDGKGRHATSGRHLIVLASGAMIIDTPGMRELGHVSADSGLEETFPEVAELSAACRFADCTHTVEEGCAVLAAVRDGTIPEKRYGNFIKMTREVAFNEMSYVERRRKDKQFGKFIKSVMKHKNKRDAIR
jgi:ribosome biogenesis GTPase / thiamine phosphate phosphatase